MPPQASEIEKLLLKHRPQDPAHGYSLEIRLQVGRWLQEQKNAGFTWEQLGRVIGFSGKTAKNWANLTRPPEENAPTFLPLLLPDSPEKAPELPTRTVLYTPNGYRVEGLQHEQLLQLLRSLG